MNGATTATEAWDAEAWDAEASREAARPGWDRDADPAMTARKAALYQDVADRLRRSDTADAATVKPGTEAGSQ